MLLPGPADHRAASSLSAPAGGSTVAAGGDSTRTPRKNTALATPARTMTIAAPRAALLRPWVNAARAAGFDRHFTKPVDFAQLEAVLNYVA